MKRLISFFLLFVLFIFPFAAHAQSDASTAVRQRQTVQTPHIAFVIHGGAGVIRRGDLSPAKEKEYRDKLTEVLLAGYKVLQSGGTSLDAVETAINLMEDSPLFNAGKGAVFNAEGKNELDASIMDGKTLMAGAVAGVHHIKNPISLARLVMEKSPHVMMAGDGAEKFAVERGVKLVSEKYFFTQERWDALQKVIRQEKEKTKAASEGKKVSGLDYRWQPYNKFGTVGAVALDKDGNLAAGTSTGGMTYKKYGRIGDSPIIGAGTYANNETCAVSATGYGEYFIRLGVARDISALMEYKNLPVQQAADLVIKTKLQNLGGDGGVIALDREGNIGISFNSEGMYRAYIDTNGKPVIEIYKAEK
ncbi:MAG: isoaspartyl peptidase/L-asparaginase family protein [Pyrinomonadaceae bacterium]